MDFTLKTYKKLLNTLSNRGFSFSTFEEFVSKPPKKIFILRHDVDSLSLNSLQFARIQAEKGISGTYYFRIVQGNFEEKIIKEIYSMGHEIGYHYEDVKECAVRGVWYAEEDLARIAIESFVNNLEKLRQVVPVKTICMHGSPMSRWDSRLLWKYYDYRDFGIVGEPYFDIDFNEVLYLTDTGRRWDGDLFNVRDRAQACTDQSVSGSELRAQGKDSFEQWKVEPKIINHKLRTAYHAPFPKFHSTFDIIKAAEEDRLPDKIMMTFHPQRWTDKPLPWMKELVWQNVKNVAKYFIVKVNS